MGKFQGGIVAVISTDPIKSVIVATDIRRANIPCETYYISNIKKQMKKAADLEAVILILDDGLYIKDMLSGIQRKVEGNLIEAVNYVLTEGYYDESSRFVSKGFNGVTLIEGPGPRDSLLKNRLKNRL
jgi:hypothetical protein